MLCVSNMESDEVRYQARIAQWVEHRVEATDVAGSIPAPNRGSKLLTAINGYQKARGR